MNGLSIVIIHDLEAVDPDWANNRRSAGTTGGGSSEANFSHLGSRHVA